MQVATRRRHFSRFQDPFELVAFDGVLVNARIDHRFSITSYFLPRGASTDEMATAFGRPEPRTRALKIGPADDHELLSVLAFDLDPQAAIAGRIECIRAFGDDALQRQLLGRAKAIVCRLPGLIRAPDDPVYLVDGDRIELRDLRAAHPVARQCADTTELGGRYPTGLSPDRYPPRC